VSSTGATPPVVLPYTCGVARMPAVDDQLGTRDEFITEVRDRLKQAQQQYKAAYDKNHRPLTFEVGAWVWLQLLHRPVASLSVHGRDKLGPRFYSPFQVAKRVR
jgi:hypothetical protein